MNATDRFCAVLRGQIPDRIPVITFAMEPHKVRTYVSLISDKPQDVKPHKADPNIEAVLEKAREVATFTIGISHPSEIALTGAQIPSIHIANLSMTATISSGAAPGRRLWENLIQPGSSATKICRRISMNIFSKNRMI